MIGFTRRAAETRKPPGASKALGWSFANTLVSRLGTLGIGIVLARILGPEAFGTYAVAFVALMAILSFNELGVSLAIVRWPGDPKDIAPTVTTVSIATSALLCAVGFVLAPFYTAAMGDAGATPVVRLLLLTVLIDGAAASPAALLQRSFRQDKRMVIDQANVWIGAILSVVLAVVGLGPMSLAVGRLAGSVVAGVMFVSYSPIPYRLGFDRAKLRPLLAFGLPLAGASIVFFAVGYADQLVVGGVLGSTALGFYVLATNLSSWPVNMFSQPLRSVAPAAFARLQHDPDQRSAVLRSLLGVLASATIPVCFFLAGSAAAVVRFVYGEVWEPAAVVLAWLAVLSVFRIFYELVYDYIVVLGFSRSILAIQLWWLIVLVPALVLGAHWAGLLGVGIAQVAVAALLVFPVYLWRLHTAGVSILTVISRVWLPLLVGIGVGAIAYALEHLIASSFLAVLASGSVAMVAVAGLLYRERRTLSELRRVDVEERVA